MKVWNFLKSGFNSVRESFDSGIGAGFKKVAAFLLAFAIFAVAHAEDPVAVTLPDTGVDVGAYITLAIAALGGVVAVAIGGYAAFLLVKKAMKWIGRALA